MQIEICSLLSEKLLLLHMEPIFLLRAAPTEARGSLQRSGMRKACCRADAMSAPWASNQERDHTAAAWTSLGTVLEVMQGALAVSVVGPLLDVRVRGRDAAQQSLSWSGGHRVLLPPAALALARRPRIVSHHGFIYTRSSVDGPSSAACMA